MTDNHSDKNNLHVKNLSIKCTTQDGQETQHEIYVGNPKSDKTPIFFQIKALESKGYSLDRECIDYLIKVQDIANKRNIPFLDLLDYVLSQDGNIS